MTNPDKLQRMDELFGRLELSAAGIHALGNLIRHADWERLGDDTMEGIGFLLMTCADAMMEAATEGIRHATPFPPPIAP